MAEEVKTPAATDAPNASEESTRPAEAPVEPAVVDAKPTEGGDVANQGEAAEEAKPSPSKEDPTTDAKPADGANADTEKDGDDTTAAPAADAIATNGTPASNKKGINNRRKSTGAVPEHKKKTPKGKKSTLELHLDAKPGDMFFVAMKGYQPWPVIIADEEMLPDTLLAKRPVSAMRIDGTYREDYLEGGKNAKDRRYPVMFLYTNEFAWEANTNLQPFDLAAVKEEVEKGNVAKKNKLLWKAYEVAAEGRDLTSYKEELAQHEQAMQDDADDKAAAQAEKAEKAEKKAKGKRKSTAAEESEDVEMEDVGDGEEAPKKKKKTNKRKAEGEGDNEKPAKTPKTKLKLNNKAPKDESATKPKKESKPKKAKAKSESEEAEAAKPEEKPLTEAEQREKQEKSVLYFRHRLQKGFLARDQTPKEEEMANMSDYLRQLEEVKNLEAETIRKTKVHKVLKAILKIESIPKEDEYNFKARCTALLTSWGKALASDEPTGESAAPTTNGVKHDEKPEAPTTTEKADEPVTTISAKETNGDGDVSMADAKDEASEVKTDIKPTTEPAADAVAETSAA